jgi:anthranilate phosphoribosyltransferase
LVLLARKGEAWTEIAGFARSMRERATLVRVPDPSRPGEFIDPREMVDIVGTGGDGHDTINISTTAAILAAACGARVAKHGSVSSSSKCGSADVLRVLGVDMLDAEGVGRCVSHAGVGFMLATMFHPAMKHVVPVRKALRVRTMFNVLGPLLNPARAKRIMLGVYSESLLDVFGAALANLGDMECALVVHCGGLDELAPLEGSVAHAVEVRGTSMTRLTIDTVAIAGPACTIADLAGGDAAFNAERIRTLLAGGDDAADSAQGRTIALNAGAGLYAAGVCETIAEGYTKAREGLRAGLGAKTLDRWVSVCHEAIIEPASV